MGFPKSTYIEQCMCPYENDLFNKYCHEVFKKVVYY